MLTITDAVRDAVRRALALIPNIPEPFHSERATINYIEGVLEWKRFNYGSFGDADVKSRKAWKYDLRRTVAQQAEEEVFLVVNESLKPSPSNQLAVYRCRSLPGTFLGT